MQQQSGLYGVARQRLWLIAMGRLVMEWLLCIYLHLFYALACRQLYTQPIMMGRCITNTENYTEIINVQHPTCFWHCLRDATCTVINFNTVTGNCFLSQDTCVSLQEDSEYKSTVLSMGRPCKHAWMSQSEPVTRGSIKMRENPGKEPPYDVYVIRGRAENNMLPGKYDGSQSYYAYNGAESVVDNPEFLTIAPGCSAEWVAYSAGGLLPAKALVCGWWQGAPVYTVRKLDTFGSSPPDEYHSIGHYIVGTSEAHIPYAGNDFTFSNVDILALKC